MDVLTKEQRLRNMRNVKGKNTGPEITLRKELYARGIRFRIHRKDLPGCPDIVLPKYKLVIFVHGCFWHRHGCKKTTVPATRQEFWLNKFKNNVIRDEKNIKELQEKGWRVFIVWECQLKKALSELCDEIERLLAS